MTPPARAKSEEAAMVSVSTSLLPGGTERRARSQKHIAWIGAASCTALFVAAVLVYRAGGPTALLTTVQQNCDGSVDITTTSFFPCAAALPSYTSVAPTIVAPPIYLPQTVAPGVAPVAPQLPFNTYQYPTVWNGANVLSAGNPEWAEEDAAMHAQNLANWRIKLLQARKVQAELSKQVMNVWNDPGGLVAGSKKKAVDQSKQLKEVKKAVASLSKSTSQALGTIKAQLDSKSAPVPSLAQSKQGGDLKQILGDMDKMAAQFGAETAELDKDEAGSDVVDGA